MITVKHVIDGSNEEIFEGSHVEYNECEEDSCPQHTAVLVLRNSDGVVVRTFRDGGTAYVMNSEGQTIARYHLPALPTEAAPPAHAHSMDTAS